MSAACDTARPRPRYGQSSSGSGVLLGSGSSPPPDEPEPWWSDSSSGVAAGSGVSAGFAGRRARRGPTRRPRSPRESERESSSPPDPLWPEPDGVGVAVARLVVAGAGGLVVGAGLGVVAPGAPRAVRGAARRLLRSAPSSRATLPRRARRRHRSRGGRDRRRRGTRLRRVPRSCAPAVALVAAAAATVPPPAGRCARWSTIAGPEMALPASTATVPAFASVTDAPPPATSSAIRSTSDPSRGRAGRRGGDQRHRRQRGRRGSHAHARPVHELAQRVVRQPEVARDLLLRVAADRRPDQRLALAVRQRGQRRQRLAHDRAALELVLAGVRDPRRLVQLGVVVAAHPQRVERRVVDDPVQPRPQLAHLVAALQRRPGCQQRLLQRILRAPLRQHAARRPQQRLAVALDDRLEGALVAVARQGGQALVGLGAEQGQRRRRHTYGCDTPRSESLRGYAFTPARAAARARARRPAGRP